MDTLTLRIRVSKSKLLISKTVHSTLERRVFFVDSNHTIQDCLREITTRWLSGDFGIIRSAYNDSNLHDFDEVIGRFLSTFVILVGSKKRCIPIETHLCMTSLKCWRFGCKLLKSLMSECKACRNLPIVPCTTSGGTFWCGFLRSNARLSLAYPSLSENRTSCATSGATPKLAASCRSGDSQFV